jgi:tripeptide aminopeptidase
VKPQVIRRYDGGDVTFAGDPDQVLRPSENPALLGYVGHDLVTSDGTTLLGADDKAGVAEIMGAVAYLTRHPEIAHGPVRIGFTPDEEIGRGTEHFDIAAFGADVAYTVDGSTPGEVEDETFSASSVTITIRGHNIHPGYAKGKMVNSVKLAAWLLAQLSEDALSPETTDGRQGYVHPMAVEGGVEQTVLRFIVRDFETAKLTAHEAYLQQLAERLRAHEPRARVQFDVKRSYRNMKDYLAAHPKATAAAVEAVRRAGLVPRRAFIRGGTDGARLSERGLPTPNLFTGAHDYHSVREWISVQDMAAAATLVHLVQVWAEPS